MDIFEFHTGFEATEKTTQNLMKCPFCEKEKFYYGKDGLWCCKSGSCGLTGNTYSFIQKIYEQSTTQIGRLAAERQLPSERLKTDGWRFNPLNRSFIFPTYNHDGAMNQLYKYDIGGKVMCSPGITNTLMMDQVLEHEQLWIVAGQWDWSAGRVIVGKTHNIDVIGVPGEEHFKDKWVPYLKHKHITIIYDNDKAGREGVQRVIKAIESNSQKPLSIKAMSWPETFKEKGDLRDVFIEYGSQSFEFLNEHIEPVEAKAGQLIESVKENIEGDRSYDTFEKVINKLREIYHVNEDMVLGLFATFCSIYSNKIGGEQLWFRLIGPPGAGKTTIVNAVSACDEVVIRSTFTGLFSGYQTQDGSDASLIPLIAGRTLMVKDADALLQQPNIDKIMSEFRDFYDKTSNPSYKNQVNHSYENIRSTFILCGTHALRRADHSFLGERFLQLELHFSKLDEQLISEKAAERAILESMSEADLPADTEVKIAVKGFVQNLMERSPTIPPPPEYVQMIRNYGMAIARIRTTIERDRSNEIMYAAKPEMPTRLIKQLIKNYAMGYVVLGREDAEFVQNYIRHIVKSTLDMDSRRMKVLEYIVDNPDCQAKHMMEPLELSQASLQRELADLRILKIIKVRTDSKKESVGRKPVVLRIASDLEDTLKDLFNVS